MPARPSVATAIKQKIEESQPDGRKTPATRAGMNFGTFPVSPDAKRQLDFLAVETGLTREELMKKALVGLFREYGKAEITSTFVLSPGSCSYNISRFCSRTLR